MQGYCDNFSKDNFEADVGRSTFTCDVIKARKLNTDVSSVIYLKFSHGAVSYTLNGENFKVMLEYVIYHCLPACTRR